MDINWLVVSVIGNILLGLYGAIFTTCTVVKANKDKKRQLSVSVSMGWRPKFHNGKLGPVLLLITVTNPGNRKVTVNCPYLGLPDGSNIITPIPLSHVRFPYKLEEGENCVIWTEMNEVKNTLIEQGYSGVVKLKGKVSDGTGKTYKSKKSWDFNVNEEYD